MATITVDVGDGIHSASGITASTVREYALPSWCQVVLVTAPESSGADLEVAWTGTDAASSLTAGLFAPVKAGGGIELEVPPKYTAASTKTLYVRPTSATSTTVAVVCGRVR